MLVFCVVALLVALRWWWWRDDGDVEFMDDAVVVTTPVVATVMTTPKCSQGVCETKLKWTANNKVFLETMHHAPGLLQKADDVRLRVLSKVPDVCASPCVGVTDRGDVVSFADSVYAVPVTAAAMPSVDDSAELAEMWSR